MKIFGFNFDEKHFTLLNFLTGCTENLLSYANLNSKVSKELLNYRMPICEKCPLGKVNQTNCFKSSKMKIKHEITGEMVEGCGCLFRCKGSVPDEFCPAGKWLAVEV
jgi:predicted PP-loop superfamily ATPase